MTAAQKQYLDNEQTLLFSEMGAFFAFNNDQFKEGFEANKSKLLEGEKFINCGYGLIMPAHNIKEFEKRHETIIKAAHAIKPEITEAPAFKEIENKTGVNTYAKYCANVFVAKCEDKHERGDIITLTTKHGKENECEVFNLVLQKDGYYYYSIIRADGYNMQERARRKAEKYNEWAESAQSKSAEWYEKSRESADFLALGEPIKIGHHSERAHRALIERNWARMGNSVKFADKANAHCERSEYWEKRANDINLSMPESLEYWRFRLEKAKAEHVGLKNGTIERAHSFALTYANKAVKDAEKNLQLAIKLWQTDDDI